MPFRVVHLGRSPKPKDLIGRSLYALGGLFRGLGGALDSLGAAVQGPYAKEDEREWPAGTVRLQPGPGSRLAAAIAAGSSGLPAAAQTPPTLLILQRRSLCGTAQGHTLQP